MDQEWVGFQFMIETLPTPPGKEGVKKPLPIVLTLYTRTD